MKYFKTPQFIPGKGEAWMYTEADDSDTVTRTMTVIPTTGEVDRIGDPIVKKLFLSPRTQPAEEAEFLKHWGEGDAS